MQNSKNQINKNAEYQIIILLIFQRLKSGKQCKKRSGYYYFLKPNKNCVLRNK